MATRALWVNSVGSSHNYRRQPLPSISENEVVNLDVLQVLDRNGRAKDVKNVSASEWLENGLNNLFRVSELEYPHSGVKIRLISLPPAMSQLEAIRPR